MTRLTAAEVEAKSAKNRAARRSVAPVVHPQPAKAPKPRISRPRGIRKAGSAPEMQLAGQLRALGITGWVREYRFAPPRRWRSDFAWPEARLLVEVEGGVWSRGRHTRGAGFLGDIKKYNVATLAGWRVLRFAPQHVKSGEALEAIRRALAG